MARFSLHPLLWGTLLSLASLSLAATDVAAGSTAAVTADGTALPDGSLNWQVKTSGGTQIASNSSPNGWTVTYSSTDDKLTITIPASATLRNDVSVRFRNGSTGESATVDVIAVSVLVADAAPVPGWAEATVPMDSIGAAGGPKGASAGGKVDLTSGAYILEPEPDIVAYNPSGPAAEFRRYYRSTKALFGQSGPGMPLGWYDGYWIRIEPVPGTGWRNLVLQHPSGATETFGPNLPGGNPDGSFTRPSGTPYRLSGTPNGSVAGRWDSLTLTHKDLTRWHFQRRTDSEYLLYQIQNRTGQAITINRSSSRLLTTVVNDAGTTLLSFATDSTAYLRRATDVPGARRIIMTSAVEAGGDVLKRVSVVADTSVSSPPTRWEYNHTALLGQRVITAVGAPSAQSPSTLVFNSTAYYVNGRVNTYGDANGNAATYEYDTSSTPYTRVTKQTSGGGSFVYTEFFDNQNDKRRTRVRDAATNSTFISYGDSLNPKRATGVVNRLSQTSGATYDADGNPLTTTNSRGVQTTMAYERVVNQFGQVTSVQTTGLTGTSYVYDPTFGLLSQIISPIPGNTTGGTQTSAEFTYNVLGDVLTAKAINAAGGWSTTTYEYLTDTDADLGNVSLMAPQQGQPLRITDPNGNPWRFRYDVRGNLAKMKDPLGAITDYQYNAENQLTRILHPATGMTGPNRGWTAFVYETVGGALKGVHEYDESAIPIHLEDYSVSSEGDARGVSGNRPSVTTPKDALGRLTKITDGNNQSTSFTYNSIGSLQRLTRPMLEQNNLTWNANGEPTGLTNARGESVTISRATDDSRVTGVQYAADPTLNTSYTYDAYSRPLTATDKGGTRTYTYDSLGNILTEATQFAGLTGTFTVAYAYNPDGSVNTMTTPKGAFTYLYDANGNNTKATAPWTGGIVDYTYDGKNRLTKQKGAKFETDLTYNARDQITDLDTYARNQPTTTRIGYSNIAYNGAGYPVSANITKPSFSATAPARSGTVSWTYNSQYNLTDEVRYLTGSVLLYDSLGITYDNAGNPTLAFGQSLPVNGNSEITATGFNYDDQGLPTLYNGQALGWDKKDDYAGNGGYTLLTFDDGRIARKTNGAGKQVFYLYDQGGRVVCEIGGAMAGVTSGTVYGAYHYGPWGLTTRYSGVASEYSAFAWDLFGSTVVRQRQFDTAMDSSEVYDAAGRLFERLNVQGTGPDPVTDAVGSFGQWGLRVEEEDRAAVTGQYVQLMDGGLYDPATGNLVVPPTAAPDWTDYDSLHLGMDVLGTLDPFGGVDSVHALVYVGEGDYGNAALTLAGAVMPYGGDALKLTRHGRHLPRVAQTLPASRLGQAMADGGSRAAHSHNSKVSSYTKYAEPKSFQQTIYGDNGYGRDWHNHHGMWNEWAAANVPGYSKRDLNVPTVRLNASQHGSTFGVLNRLRARFPGGKIDWRSISKEEMYRLSEEMFNNAGVPRDVRREYYRRFNKYIKKLR